MSYGQRITYKVGTAYVECDKCHRREQRGIAGTYRECEDQQADLYVALISEGWTWWASRVSRVYCPTCGPSKGHKMTEVTDSVYKRAMR